MTRQPKHTIVIDFETYYTTEYSLKNKTVTEYVHSAGFQIIGVAYKLDDNDIVWLNGNQQIKKELRELPWEDSVVVAHNAIFDAYILEHKIKVTPLRYFCTMMGARPIIASKTGSVSLATVSKEFGFGEKGTEVYNARDKTLFDFTKEELAAYGEYCVNDVQLTYLIYQYCMGWFELNNVGHPDEIDLIDLTIKKFTRPRIELDVPKIIEALRKETEERIDLLFSTGVERGDLLSNEKFAGLLRGRGVTPPMKVSNTTGQPTYAFSKTDRSFKALLNNPLVSDLVKARLKIKSTMMETRLETFRRIGLKSPKRLLPIPLLYYGAHTGRFSGMDGINMQNLPRGSVLREAMIAPEGSVVVAADLSQIEARLTACFCGQWDLVEQFARGDDVYSNFAGDIFGYKVTEETHPRERFIGKTGILSLGYQSGAQKYHDTLNDVFGVPIERQEADEVVFTYRQRFKQIRNMWYELEDYITCMYRGVRRELGPVQFDHNKVILPNGMPIYYHDLKSDKSYVHNGRDRAYVYGGRLLENIVQALARIVMTTAELRLARHGLYAAMSVHDELVFVVKEENAPLIKEVVKQVMEHPVSWMPELPVACKVNSGRTYKECK